MKKTTPPSRARRNILLAALLALCIGTAELAACSFYEPVLYERITAPVRRTAQAVAQACGRTAASVSRASEQVHLQVNLFRGPGDRGGSATAGLGHRLGGAPDGRGNPLIEHGLIKGAGRQLRSADTQGQQGGQKNISPGPTGGSCFFHDLTTKKMRDSSCMIPSINGIISKEPTAFQEGRRPPQSQRYRSAGYAYHHVGKGDKIL